MQSTILKTLLGVMDLFPVFGKYFIIFYPMILLLLSFLNVFNIIEKISKLIGFSTFTLKNINESENVDEGLTEFNRSKLHFFFLFKF